MHIRTTLTITTTALAVGATVALGGVASAGAEPSANAAAKPVRKTVKVGDNFYSPRKLTVPRNSTIKWAWLSDNSETHDVYLSKGPGGVKRFHSEPAATDYSYAKKLTRKGTYSVICTFHENMKQKITVR